MPTLWKRWATALLRVGQSQGPKPLTGGTFETGTTLASELGDPTHCWPSAAQLGSYHVAHVCHPDAAAIGEVAQMRSGSRVARELKLHPEEDLWRGGSMAVLQGLER